MASRARRPRLPAIGCREAVLNRLGSVKALNGRDRLVEELHALGYELALR